MTHSSCTVSAEIQQILWLSIALLIHHTSPFALFSLSSTFLWGSEGKEQGYFFCRWENLRWILNSTLEAYWKSSSKFLFFKSLWSCHIPARYQNLRAWHPTTDIFQSTHESKVQLRLRTTSLNNLYSIFKCNCLLPKCSLSTNEKDISFPWIL